MAAELPAATDTVDPSGPKARWAAASYPARSSFVITFGGPNR